MSWWTSLIRRLDRGASHESIDFDELRLPGWTLLQSAELEAAWRDSVGDVVTLTATEDIRVEHRLLTDEVALQQTCRRWAEAQGAGLVEAGVVEAAQQSGYAFIYKKLKRTAFTFTGMLVLPRTASSWVWAVVCVERGVTGVREAWVTSHLVNAGKLTPESYEACWARDPYDPGNRGVERRTLRYLSDAKEYDEMFPAHPLSKTRRILQALLRINLKSAAR